MSKKKKYTVYKHISPSNKIYIGITNQHPPHKRWKSGEGYYHNEYFQNSIRKYGWENFQHEILYEGLTAEEAANLEIDLIAKFKSNCKEHGYNLTAGGGGRIGLQHTEETKVKMSKAAKGKPKSMEHRKNISRANVIRFSDPMERKKMALNRIGKKFTPEQCRKLSEIRTGYRFSEEAKKKMSESAIKSWDDARRKSAGKAVEQYDLKGNYLRTFNTITEAGRFLGKSHCYIGSVCNGKGKTSHGFIWRWKNEQD